MHQLLKAVLLAAALMGQAHAQTIDDAAWLAGRWVGEGFGGQMEEAWAPPIGGQMIGHFRYWREGAPQFYEFLTLEAAEGGLRMRVKHFSPDHTAWEEREVWTTFEPVSVSADALIFNGLEIRREGEDRMVMHLRMRRGETVTTEVLRFQRAPL
ncbi:MAG TPA: DUF6265 family protein [Terricaulis sp.]|nr:DUF6265 family protein [Terricaulis sp.]